MANYKFSGAPKFWQPVHRFTPIVNGVPTALNVNNSLIKTGMDLSQGGLRAVVQFVDWTTKNPWQLLHYDVDIWKAGAFAYGEVYDNDHIRLVIDGAQEIGNLRVHDVGRQMGLSFIEFSALRSLR